MYDGEEEQIENNVNAGDMEECEEKGSKSPKRDCKSPTEAADGDDESKDDEEDEEPRRRKSRRVVRVEEGDENDVIERRSSKRVTRQSSSEDEVGRTRISSATKTYQRKVSSSEDEVAIKSRRKVSVKDRAKSFEGHSSGSDQPTSASKRTSFSSTRANTVATSSEVASKRESFSKERTKSVEAESSPRRSSRRESTERPDWSSSTRVEHDRVATNTMSRKESSTQSESDEPKSAAQLLSRWETKGKSNSKDVQSKTKAFGGSTGAAALKARFETSGGSSSYQRRKSSSSGRDRNRTMSTDDEDGGHRKLSTLSLKARFEAKAADAAPVKRNFVINKNRTNAAAKKFNMAAPASNKCTVCNKTVYPMEKLEANSLIYHKFCFKCTTCNRTVGLGSYAALQGQIYCKPHLKQLFKLKGNYDEGFGRAQRKADWVNKDGRSGSRDDLDDVSEQQNEENVVMNGNGPHDD